MVYFTDIEPEGGAPTGASTPGRRRRRVSVSVEHAFNELGLHTLNGEVLATSTAVVNLHKKCGFTREGVLREQRCDGEQHVDVIRLGVGRLLPETLRARFDHTLMVHESNLPRGRSWFPPTWQIVDGAERIPVTRIEAADQVDSGTLYAQR